MEPWNVTQALILIITVCKTLFGQHNLGESLKSRAVLQHLGRCLRSKEDEGCELNCFYVVVGHKLLLLRGLNLRCSKE